MPPERSVFGRTLQITAIVGLLIYCTGICLTEHRPLGVTVRTVGLALLFLVSIKRRSLTTWTFFAILAGAEIGADAPSAAVHLHILADIFLRLVRLIVAPLILGTLTTGIAAHGHLRSLGRIAWKTLLYFEIVTTLALLL